jgi:hypothetical protein
LHTDGLTAAKSRIRFSRICVEIDASPDFVEDFYLSCDNGDWITVFAELEWGWAQKERRSRDFRLVEGINEAN